MSRRLRPVTEPVAEPFAVAVPAAARVRTRLAVSAADVLVLQAVGGHWGRWRGLTWPRGAGSGGWMPGARRSPGGSASGR